MKPLRKDITFIYSDSAERAIYAPLITEAERRGYVTRITNDKFAKCEIGVYCQHTNLPQFSKFSIIMLHDIIQQYGNWPDIWYREPWDKYDVGILPSMQWVENWQKCSQWSYARPRKGMYLVGWPKADVVSELSSKEKREELIRSIGLDSSKRTVLYAPAWENDGKQVDFVNAMSCLGVNALVKQWDADPISFPSQVKNVHDMAALHKNKEGVTILPPETNIFTAIAVSDVLISEESSTMCEAAMMGIPAVSVSDWLIPDTVPSRFPKCDYTFVTKTTRDKLEECVGEILSNYGFVKHEVESFAENNFSNIGRASSMIMDIVDDCVNNKDIRYDAITSAPNARPPFCKEVRRRAMNLKGEVYSNQRVRYPAVGALWRIGSNAKKAVRHIVHRGKADKE